jgi:hypothetical protein
MASVTWDGMDELQAVLEALPEDLGEAGGMIARESANQAAAAIKAAYPYRGDVTHKAYAARGWPAHLRDGVIVREKPLPLGLRVVVVSTSPYAYAFESGRRKGKHGTTPARPTFIPIRNKYQRGYVEAIVALLEERGLRTSGSAET